MEDKIEENKKNRKIKELFNKKNLEILKLLFIGGLIALFLRTIIDDKGEIIFSIVTGICLFLLIVKTKSIKSISYIYISSISKEFEIMFISTLLILSLFLVNLKESIMIFYLFFNITVLLYMLVFREKNDDKEDKLANKKLFSFRENELNELEKIINDKKISTVLIDDNIGNGKTFLLEYFLEKNKNDLEVIYLKLPLVKDLESLTNIIFDEISKILRKNNIYSDNKNLFFNKLETVKLGIFEFKHNNSKSTWDLFIELKENIEKIEKNKKIIIILDDIERESSSDKIKECICFLGELSEYLRNTKTTFLFLAQNDSIEKKINSSKDEINFSEKYFGQKIKLFFPNFSELKQVDFELLAEESIEKITNEKYLKNNIIYIYNLLKILEEKAENKKINLKNKNFRSLKSYMIYFKDCISSTEIENNCNLALIYIYKAFDFFIYEEDHEKMFKENIYDDLQRKLKEILSITSSIDVRSNELKIQSKFKRMDLRKSKKIINIEKIVKYLKGDIKYNKDSFNKQINHNELRYLFRNINEENINLFLELKLKSTGDISFFLIELIIKIKSLKYIHKNNLEIFLKIFEDEEKNKRFYFLEHIEPTGMKFEEDENEEKNKIVNLTKFKRILKENEEEIVNKDTYNKVLEIIDLHINEPWKNSIDSESYEPIF